MGELVSKRRPSRSLCRTDRTIGPRKDSAVHVSLSSYSPVKKRGRKPSRNGRPSYDRGRRIPRPDFAESASTVIRERRKGERDRRKRRRRPRCGAYIGGPALACQHPCNAKKRLHDDFFSRPRKFRGKPWENPPKPKFYQFNERLCACGRQCKKESPLIRYQSHGRLHRPAVAESKTPDLSHPGPFRTAAAGLVMPHCTMTNIVRHGCRPGPMPALPSCCPKLAFVRHHGAASAKPAMSRFTDACFKLVTWRERQLTCTLRRVTFQQRSGMRRPPCRTGTGLTDFADKNAVRKKSCRTPFGVADRRISVTAAGPIP